jgi:regulator of vacuolar morphogenesis
MPYTLSIPTTSLASDSSSPYTLYHLTVATPLRKKVLRKRYSDFSTIHASLTSETGSAPPAPLPAKSWFSRTVNNPDLTEKRRAGLETYVKAIEAASDSKWRESDAWQTFLGQATGGSSRSSIDGGTSDFAPSGRASMTSGQWLEAHKTMKQLLQDARTQLARRESASTTTAAHDASANAKKALVKAHTQILRLEDGLKGLGDAGQGERLGDGEIRRRRDLIARARKEREALEGVLNAWIGRGNPGVSAAESIGAGPKKQELFSGAKSSPPTRSSAGLTTVGMPGAFPGSSVPGRSGRVLGGPAKETERTRERDNEGVLQLQKQVMQEQDMDVEELGKVVRRMREMGVAINEELVEQAQLLDVLDQDVDRVGSKIDVAKKRIRKIN